jgi:D-alanyl-D-alanine carboxypeptidase/D-alanyl-D-alanine-endopeptidase (penicillin-binding protein 4)
MGSRRVRYAWLVLLVIVVAAAALAAGGAGFVLTRDARQHRADADRPTPPPTPRLLQQAAAAPGGDSARAPAPLPRAAALARELDKALGAPALGGPVLAEVVDAQTGTALYRRQARTGGAPASVAKLLTAVAALTAYPAGHRFDTRVLAGGSGTIVLVGGGDPTLSGAAAGKPNPYAGAARVSGLAAQLRARHADVRRIVVDTGLFTGASISPDWVPEDVPSSYASPITALMVDGGRDSPAAPIRSADPALAAGRALAAALGEPSLPVAHGAAPRGARQLAVVHSAPLLELVTQMLQFSDNVIAECLGRQVAIARHRAASFSGAVSAIRAELASLGVPTGSGMRDASGLAAADRLSPATIAAVLHLIAGPARPSLHAIVTALPVASWSGTLADRYLPGSTGAAGAGVVRAKTGTLTGVSTVAGLVHDRSGRLLAFVFLADRVPRGEAATRAAEAALDHAAATLAGCGCR